MWPPFRQAARLPPPFRQRRRSLPGFLQEQFRLIRKPNPWPQASPRPIRTRQPRRECPGIHCRTPPSNQAESVGVPAAPGNTCLPVTAGRRIVTGAEPHPGQSRADTGQPRIHKPDRSRINLRKELLQSGNETESPAGRTGTTSETRPVSDSARLDWGERREALATEATRLREMAARRRPEPHQADRPGRADGGGERGDCRSGGATTRIP